MPVIIRNDIKNPQNRLLRLLTELTSKGTISLHTHPLDHAPGSDNQDLSGKADLVDGKVPADQLPESSPGGNGYFPQGW
jgi:hypothetical protein